MRSFDILYYDGKTSISHKAILLLEKDYFRIEYLDPENRKQIVPWTLAGVERDVQFDSLFIFRYGEFPKETIECKDENLPEALQKVYPDKAFATKKTAATLSQNTVLIVSLTLALIGFMVASYVYFLPWLAEKAAEQIPVSMEVTLGETMFENMVGQYKKNDNLTAKVNEFVQAVDFKTGYPIKVTVVQEDEMNAFALPGGNIVIFDKLLNRLESKEELAALLAHEVSHIHYRHSLKSIFRSLSGYLVIALIFNDINGIAAIVADNSNMLVNLNFSRSLEHEADAKAVEILKANRLDINGFVNLLKLLQSGEKGKQPFKLLSTHPLTNERMAFAKKSAKNQPVVSGNDRLEIKWKAITVNQLK